MMTRSESLAALAVAKARAQAKFLPLGKEKSVTVATKAGGSYSYAYADLAACLESVIPALSEVGLALFQPVRVEDGFAIATTLLVHGESGEWIASDYTTPAVDPLDARSVGSAATYARRYGLLSMLAIASQDEDDDGQEARGGAHEMARTPSAQVCPVCGQDAIIKGKAEYGGGWLCFRKKNGCGLKWPDGPFPTTPPADLASTGPITPAALEQEADRPSEPVEDANTLLGRIIAGFSKLKMAKEDQIRAWDQHVGGGVFLSPQTDVAALGALLADLRAMAKAR